MSNVIQIDGPAHIYCTSQVCVAPSAIPAFSELAELGITESGVQISLQGMTHKVVADDCGGSEGTPADLIVMGNTASIRGVLVRINSTNFSNLMNGVAAASASEGTVLLPGTPVFGGNYGFGVIIVGSVITYYFPKAECLTAPREFNISSTEKKISFTFTAYPAYAATAAGTHVLYMKAASGVGVTTPGYCDAYGGSVAAS